MQPTAHECDVKQGVISSSDLLSIPEVPNRRRLPRRALAIVKTLNSPQLAINPLGTRIATLYMPPLPPPPPSPLPSYLRNDSKPAWSSRYRDSNFREFVQMYAFALCAQSLVPSFASHPAQALRLQRKHRTVACQCSEPAQMYVYFSRQKRGSICTSIDSKRRLLLQCPNFVSLIRPQLYSAYTTWMTTAKSAKM
jgi:hypothetical protein